MRNVCWTSSLKKHFNPFSMLINLNSSHIMYFLYTLFLSFYPYYLLPYPSNYHAPATGSWLNDKLNHYKLWLCSLPSLHRQDFLASFTVTLAFIVQSSELYKRVSVTSCWWKVYCCRRCVVSCYKRNAYASKLSRLLCYPLVCTHSFNITKYRVVNKGWIAQRQQNAKVCNSL